MKTTTTGESTKKPRAAGLYRYINLALLLACIVATALWIRADLLGDGLLGSPGQAAASTLMQPVPSRSLVVTIVPLVPGEAALAQLDAGKAEPSAPALALTSAAGVDQLIAGLEQLYPFTYRAGEPLTIPDEFLDAGRGQYNIEKTLTWLIRQRDPASYKTIGIIAADVYKPGYNFLFGLAKIAGPACCASSHRMGMAEVGDERARQRWIKIVRHELGHTFGLQHNEDWSSVMRYGDSLYELDKTGAELTKADEKRLRQILPVHWQH